MLRGGALSAAVVAGVAVGVVCPVRPLEAAALALAAASVALPLHARWPRGVFAIAAVLFAAMADGAWARDRALTSPLEEWLDARAVSGRLDAPVRVRGTIAEDASVNDNGVRIVIDVDRLEVDGQQLRLPGRMQATVAGAMSFARQDDWRAGRGVDVPVTLRTLDVWRNPGSPSETWQRLRRAVDAAGSVKSGALVQVTPGPWWREAEASVRAHVRRAADEFVKPRGLQSAAIVTAILIGDRAGLDPAVQRRLQAAGTYHVIAISGGNVALVTAICFTLTRLIARSPRAPAIVTIVVILAYSAVLGDDPSIRRAVAAATLYFALSLAGLVPRAVNLLALVAMLVAVVDPLVVIDVGAWLSFGATLGIIVGTTRVSHAMQGISRWRPAGAVGVLAAQMWSLAVGLGAATVCAEIALLPVSAEVFSRVGIAGLALNFAAIPAMSVVEIAGFVMTLTAAWAAPLARWSGAIVDWAARVLVGSTTLLDVLPWLSWRVPPVAVGWVIVYYVAWLGVLSTQTPRRWRLAALGAGVLAGIVIGTAPMPLSGRPLAGRLRLTMIDVGQGDALALQLPTGQSLLVDAGGLGEFDVGGRVVTPTLWALGVRRLDWLAFTHPDADHIGGALSVSGDLDPREIWEGVPVPRNHDRAMLLAAAAGRGRPWRELHAGDRLAIGDVEIDVVHPPVPDWERQRARNDDSLVLRVSFGEVELLLTGDAGVEFENAFESALPAENPAPALRVLKVGHHGSRSSSSMRFVQTFRPQIALVSAGRGNLFGHPAPDVIARFIAAGARVFRTDLDGAVVLETDGRSIDVRTWSGESWTISVDREDRAPDAHAAGVGN